MKKGDLLTLKIEDLADGQKCVARLDDGQVVFVHGPVAVGDNVSAQVFKMKKNYLEAKMIEVIDPSPSRVTPKCTHFGICGGCKWQHIDYSDQLQLKAKQVRDALDHIGGFSDPPMEGPIPAPEQFHYRNKIEFTFSDQRYLLDEEMELPDEELSRPRDFAVGFHRAGAYRKIIDIDECFIATPEMNVVLTTTREFFRDRKTSIYNTDSHTGYLRNIVIRTTVATNQLMVYLLTSSYDESLMDEYAAVLENALGEKLTTLVNGVTDRKNKVAYADRLEVVRGKGAITERLGELVFDIAPNAFFQTNSKQALRLYELVREYAELQGDETVCDLYCGTGTIALFLATHCAKITGIELEPSAVEKATENAVRNQIENASFYQSDLKNYKQIMADNHLLKPSVVVTDPPRAGMHPKTTEHLIALSPRRIVYVSCNPASLARDGAKLCEAGYALKRVRPIDLFPHTYHIESVVVFEK